MLRFQKIMGALLVVLTTACGGVPTSNGAASDRDASTSNQETAVREDTPLPQPDVPVTTEDAGPATHDAQDSTVAPSDAPEDRPMSDGVVIMMAFSNATCQQLNNHRWRLPGAEIAERIVCRMIAGNQGRVTVPANLSAVMFPEALCFRDASGDTCEGRTIEGHSTGTYWRGLGPTMTSFRYTAPGRPDIVVEAD